jgi:AraC-like DNA-binding protein
MRREDETGLLLAERFSRVSTADVLAARPVIEQLQGPYVARPGAPEPRRDMRISAAQFGAASISTFAFGREVDIIPCGLADAVIVTTGLKGRGGIVIADRIHDVGVGDTIIAHEEDQPVFIYGPDTEVLKLRFQRARLEQFFLQVHGKASPERLRFDTAMSDSHTAARWLALLRFLVLTLNGPGEHAPSNLELASIEELLMLTLLNHQPHKHHSEPVGRGDEDAPASFGRAVSYIRQNLTGDISLTDIAEAACCSPRTLARVFKQAGELTPIQYVHKLRLQAIRADLLQRSTQNRTVADIAFQWGCRHLGEFNRQYRAAFGETPSATRLRGRALILPGAGR